MTEPGGYCGEALHGELELISRVPSASNAVFYATIGDTPVVYKPSAGEQWLWDFPDGDLARREVAAYLVSEAFGWGIVPPTWIGDGPFGEGMVQLWREPVRAFPAVDLVATNATAADGFRRVFEVIGDPDFPVAIVHEDSAALRRIAVFDAVINNADRKGGHILEMPDGHRHGIDHGLTFHVDDKLRTVLWGWAGEQLTDAELDGVAQVRAALTGPLGAHLVELLSPDELELFDLRCELLLAEARFPTPVRRFHTVPWPLL
ncbi:SCO1664 family protein [Gryllotalpicola reticulitermitis]|uniref:SCO1664 family protein n=1 Tax=Gryllotalpicola reticulitermitis TaxID=1184153 RepID=A0ABV8Q998_9MICO